MKQKLTLLLIALFTTVGAWATSPAEGAYPVEGKTYYLFANKYNSTDRYYLYWDNTNSALKHATANNKENNDYYKWTVTISEGLYTITNVGTGTSLKWNSGLTLGADGLQFDLSKDVNYTACVSLYATIPDGGRWLCVKNDTETFANGYKYSAFGNYSDHSINFVFEEVLSAHSLTDGKYYTIYCDNDNKQYLYDNAGTLAQTSSAPASDLRYVWQCIVNGDYYNFRNLQTGKYLSHKVISSSANNFTIETTDVYHDGCVKLKTNSTYMGFTTAGAPDQASHARFPKVTTDYSFDFRFDAIDLSSWCTGDLLGGSISGTDNWTNTWTSGTSPSFTLTASASNINHKDNRTQGGLDIRSGTALSSTYYITAPTGYVVTGYNIVGYALNGNQTVAPSKGGDATIFTTAGNSISVSGLRQGKASFTLSGANDGLFIRALQVSLAPIASSITSLPTANNKTYIIYNARAAWNFADNATSMNAVAVDLDDEKQQIALIYHNENYYLYSVNAGKYLTAENTLTSVVTDNEQISITATGDATYPWFFTFKNVADKNINIDGNPTVRINSHSTLDAGNQNAIIEADDFDATEALAMFNNRYATYNLSYGGNSTFRTVNNVVVAIGGDPADYVPEAWKAAYCTLTYDVETIEESTTTVNLTLRWDGPFDFSSDFSNAIWYYMAIKGEWLVRSDATPYQFYTLDEATAAGTNSLWAFVGNPIDGVRIINKAAGDGKFLDLNNTIQMTEGTYPIYSLCRIQQNSYGFTLDNDEYYMVNNSGLTGGNNEWKNSQGAAITLQGPYYYDLYLEKLALFEASADKIFGPTQSALDSYKAAIDAPAIKTESYYNLAVSALNGIAKIYPEEDKYYVVKNVGTNNYLHIGTENEDFGQDGLYDVLTTSTLDASCVVRISMSNSKPYFNGQNLQYSWASASPNATTGNARAETAPGKYVHYSVTTPGQAGLAFVLGNGEGDYSSYTANSYYTDNSGTVIGGTDGNDNAQWTMEEVTTVPIRMNEVDGKYWGTMYLPFDVTLPTPGPTNAVFACLVTVTPNNRAQLTSLPYNTRNIPANTPVLLYGEGCGTSINVTITSGAADIDGDNDLAGTFFDKTSLEANEYVFGTSDGELGFWKLKSGKKVGANKAYLVVPGGSGVKGYALSFEDIEDGIKTLSDSPLKDENIYNLAGQRLGKMQKGINIVNGKKVIIK